jgi:predicted NBD/HSP70 family sugar kinase
MMRPAVEKSHKILVVDVGGTHVKVRATGKRQELKISSGVTMTPRKMVREVKRIVKDWDYDVVSVGYPGPVIHGRPVHEPHNLGHGWVGFDFGKAFGCPVKVINDAAMQALGSYHRGPHAFSGSRRRARVGNDR